MLDKNEAPEGYEAVECGLPLTCIGCCFFDKKLEVCENRTVPCTSSRRKDRTQVYFIREKPEQKSYECWAYIGADGKIVVDSLWREREEVYQVMFGYCGQLIDDAKARGDRVVKVKITEIG